MITYSQKIKKEKELPLLRDNNTLWAPLSEQSVKPESLILPL